MLQSPLQDDLRRFAPRLQCNAPHHRIVQHQVLHMPLLEPLRAQRAIPLRRSSMCSRAVAQETLICTPDTNVVHDASQAIVLAEASCTGFLWLA